MMWSSQDDRHSGHLPETAPGHHSRDFHARALRQDGPRGPSGGLRSSSGGLDGDREVASVWTRGNLAKEFAISCQDPQVPNCRSQDQSLIAPPQRQGNPIPAEPGWGAIRSSGSERWMSRCGVRSAMVGRGRIPEDERAIVADRACPESMRQGVQRSLLFVCCSAPAREARTHRSPLEPGLGRNPRRAMRARNPCRALRLGCVALVEAQGLSMR
jgi:hypothetical protein